MSDTETDLWQVEYGNGGWIRVTSSEFAGWLYLRVRLDQDRPVPVELYYDGRDQEVGARMLRELPPLANVAAWAYAESGPMWTAGIGAPGPNLSLLASFFQTRFGSQAKHWVADSMRAQREGSGVSNPRPPKPPPTSEAIDRPEPLRAPEQGLTDAFLRSVAQNYFWALRQGQRPAPTLSKMAGVSARTVHGWVAKARDRGIMPRASQGRTS